MSARLLDAAQAASSDTGCIRRAVGAVVYDIDTQQHLGSGSNARPGPVSGPCPRASSTVASGSIYVPGQPGACDAIHAEENALLDALENTRGDLGHYRIGVAVNLQPCVHCVALCARWGVCEIQWPDGGYLELLA